MPSTDVSSPTLNAERRHRALHPTKHPAGSGGQREDVSESGVTGIAPHMTRLFGTVTPEPDTTLTLHHRQHRRPSAPRAPTTDKRPLDTKRIRSIWWPARATPDAPTPSPSSTPDAQSSVMVTDSSARHAGQSSRRAAYQPAASLDYRNIYRYVFSASSRASARICAATRCRLGRLRAVVSAGVSRRRPGTRRTSGAGRRGGGHPHGPR